MIANHSHFIDAIRDQKMVRIAYYSNADAGTVDRECAPLDYGPDSGAADSANRYWIWDHVGSAGANPLGLSPDQIVSVSVLGQGFDPGKLALGERAWSVPREWKMSPASPPPPPAVK